MRKSIFFGAAAALAIAAPGVASADMTGYAGATYAAIDDSDYDIKDRMSSWHGAFAAPLHGAWTFQFDANVTDMDDGNHTHAWGAAQAHVFTRNESYAFGGFLSQLNIDSDNFYGLGLEGAMYFGDFTWSGQAGWAQATYDNPDDIVRIGTQGTYYISPNFAVSGELGWTDSEWEGEEAITYGLGGEYQFAGSPFSVSLSWVRADSDYDGGGSHEIDAFTIGGRLNFGTADLRDREHNGASMSGMANAVRDAILMW